MPVDLGQQVLLEVVHGTPLLALVEGEGLQGHGVEIKLSKNRLPIASDEGTGRVAVILGGREGGRREGRGGGEGGRGGKGREGGREGGREKRSEKQKEDREER